MDRILLPRHERAVPLLSLCIKREWVALSGYRANTRELRIRPVPEIVESLHPRAVRGRRKYGETPTCSEILAKSGKTFHAGELIRFTVDIGVYLLPFEG